MGVDGDAIALVLPLPEKPAKPTTFIPSSLIRYARICYAIYSF
jgi:hypothetical protein